MEKPRVLRDLNFESCRTLLKEFAQKSLIFFISFSFFFIIYKSVQKLFTRNMYKCVHRLGFSLVVSL